MKKRWKSGPLTPGEYATFAGGGVETNEVLGARRRFVFALWSVYRDCVKKLDSRAFGACTSSEQFGQKSSSAKRRFTSYTTSVLRFSVLRRASVVRLICARRERIC